MIHSPPDDPYFALEPVTLPGERRAWSKSGVRGYPGPAPAAEPLAPFVGAAARRAAEIGAPLIDATGSAGMVLATIAGELEVDALEAEVLEPSAAALRCARATLPERRCDPGLAWDPAGRAGALLLAPPADRGTARVEAELHGAARALAPGGVVYLALHKDRGGKRYARRAAELFGRSEVVGRGKGWRVVRAADPRSEAAEAANDPSNAPSNRATDEPDAPWREAILELPAGRIRFDTLPGVHAAGKLDPGTAELVALLPRDAAAGADVLDLGCGSGVLARVAADAGAATVTALDDDLAAVRSAARALGEAGHAIHSDLDAVVPTATRFDLVLCNPPFHVGRGVRLALPRAFLRAAARRLRPGGELWLVANAQLPYERELEGVPAWRRVEVLPAGRFKVLHAVRGGEEA